MDFKGKKIVLIDDEPGVTIALKLLLQIQGFIVEVFNDPQKALDFIKQNLPQTSNNKIDYILCDLRMPKKSGFDVFSELKSSASSIPFFMMSGHADEEEQQKAVELRVSGFISKPFSPEEFLKLL